MDTFTDLEAVFMGWMIPVFNLVGNNRYTVALIVMLITISLAWLISRVVYKYLRRLLRKTRNTVDEELHNYLRQPIFFTILIFGIDITTDILIGDGRFIRLLDSIFTSLLVLIWTLFFIRAARLLLTKISHQEKGVVTTRTLPILQNLTLVIISSIAIYMLFTTWDVDMTAWLASAGVLGIAIGFAAKDTLGNLISGVFIMADAPYKIGDYVVLQDGMRGEIQNIGLRSTRLLTRDDVEVTIPNSIMGNTAVINETGGPHEKYRIRVKVGVAYGSDIDQVRKHLLEVARRSTFACDFPEPRVRFRNFGGSGLEFELLCWINEPVLKGRALDDINSAVYRLFQQEGIEIPYSKQDVYIEPTQ
ncbi:MAG: mechanosensitive ion channel family protein [Pseudomonadota bacterium]|nr:mechanosensitive ion channel family protein [Pseudomonadota bacterium]